MKKFALLLYLILITCSVQAQEGKNQIGIAAEAGIPMGNFGDRFKTSVGGSLKGLYGIGKNGQVTFTTGFMRFKSDGAISRTSIIPFLGGYRHNLANGIYLEPQLGYGIYKLRQGH